MVSTIKENPGIHVTALAEKLSVTTGAVSQVLAKLEKKKLILKEKDRLNQSRYLLRLTAEGERIHKNHLKFHEKFDRMFKELISNLTEENMNLIINFLTGIKNKIEGR
jgi:DNA-binding MarR family transcriptional regulator